jgi:hypothetical protein
MSGLPIIIPVYQGLIVTSILGIFMVSNSAGDFLGRIFFYAVVIYAAGVGLILLRKIRSPDGNPDTVDVQFVRWGSLITFIIVLALNNALGGG